MISDFVAPEHCGRSDKDKEARTLRKCRWVFVFAALFFMLGPSAAFVEGQTSYLQSIGVPSFSTAIPIENGHINVANGDLHLEIPIGGSFPQRGGGQFKAALIYDSAIWNTSYSHTWAPFNINPSLGGWQFVASGFPGYVSFTSTAQRCVEYDPALVT